MGDSFYIILDSASANAATSDDFTVTYSNQINLGDGQYEVALSRLNLWYSWYNISAENGNNTLRYFNSAVYRDVVFPDGQYSVPQINDYLHSVMKAFGDFTLSGSTEVYDIEITANFATNKVNVQLTSGYTLDLSTGNLYLLLGSDQIEVTTNGDLPNLANLTNDINAVWARCSLINGLGSYVNNSQNDVIYTFVPDTIPNTNIDLSPITLAWIPVNVTNNVIRNIRVRITDNLNRRLNLNGEPVTFTLIIRKARSSYLQGL